MQWQLVIFIDFWKWNLLESMRWYPLFTSYRCNLYSCSAFWILAILNKLRVTLNDSIEIFKEVGKWCRTDEAICELCFIGLFIDCDELGSYNSINVSFSNDVCDPLEIVDPSLIAFLLIDVIKHILKIFTGCAKINLVFPAIVLIV